MTTLDAIADRLVNLSLSQVPRDGWKGFRWQCTLIVRTSTGTTQHIDATGDTPNAAIAAAVARVLQK